MPAIVLLAISAASAAPPVLGVVAPRGGQRGQSMVVDVYGSGLEKLQDVMFHGRGMACAKIEPVDGGHAKATLKIDADAPIGLQALRVRTAAGVSNIKLFSIGNLPETNEAEPNGDRAAPQMIAPPVTVNGIITTEDVDLFAFDAKAGQTVAVEVEAMRLGDLLFDPAIAVYDPAGKPIASADDTPLAKQDAALVVTCPSDGRYVVEMRETAYGGSPDCRYRLHIGAMPRPVAAIPAGGRVGSEIELTWLGDPTIGTQRITVPGPAYSIVGVLPMRAPIAGSNGGNAACSRASAATAPGGAAASTPVLAPGALNSGGPNDAGCAAPSAVPFRTNDLNSVVEAEPNNDDDHATPMSVPGGASGVIGAAGDVDCFVFDGKKGQAFEAGVFARRLRSALDSVLNLRRLKGAEIAGNDDAVGPDSVLRFTIPEDGKHVFQIRDLLLKGGPTYSYYLEVAPVRPELTLSMLPESGAVAVAGGNRAAILVTANRKDFGGPLVMDAKGLPAGVTMIADTVPANVNQIPIVFEVASNASSAPVVESASAPAAPALSGALVDLTAHHADPKTAIAGGLAHAIDLVKLDNNPFYQWSVDRVALAVVEPIPLHISLIEPHVPIVQRGSMELSVRVERSGDFKGEVTLRMLWNPPGIASGQVTVPASAAEGRISLNAADGAAVGRWRIVVVATANNGGPVEVAAVPVTLEIAPPFVDFAIARTRTELGKPVEVVVKVAQRAAFEGEAKADLLGLPPKVAASQAALSKATQELKFNVSVDQAAPAGQYGSVFVRAVVMRDGQPIVHQSAAGILILDAPLPPPDPKVEAERVVAKQAAEEAKVKKKADRIAAAEKRKKEREQQRSAASAPGK